MMHLYSAGDARPLAARLAAVLADPPADPMTPEWLAVPSDGMRRWLTLELASRLGASGPGGRGGGQLHPCLPGDPSRPRPGRRPRSGSGRSVEHRPAGVGGAGCRRRAARGPGPRAVRRPAHRSLPVRLGPAHRRPVRPLPPAPAGHGPRLGGGTWTWTASGVRSPPTRPGSPTSGGWSASGWASPARPSGGPASSTGCGTATSPSTCPAGWCCSGSHCCPGSDFLELAGAVAERRDLYLFMLEPAHLDARPAAAVESPGRAGGAQVAGRRRRPSVSRAPAAAVVGPPPPGDGADARRCPGRGSALHSSRWGRPPPTPPPSSVGCSTTSGPTPCPTPSPASTPQTARSSSTPATGPPDRSRCSGTPCCTCWRRIPALTEDDILVLCPALERFAPLVEAVFGPSADRSRPAPEVGGARATTRVPRPCATGSPTGRSGRSNPVVGATTELLELVAGRFDAAGVLDFCSLGPVRERFGFDDEDLAAIGEWVRATNVRWGLDARPAGRLRRARGGRDQHLAAALDRLLLGSAVHDADFDLGIGDVAPFGCEGSDVETVGRLAEVLWRLGELASQSGDGPTAGSWVGRLDRAVTALFACPAARGGRPRPSTGSWPRSPTPPPAVVGRRRSCSPSPTSGGCSTGGWTRRWAGPTSSGAASPSPR